MTFPHPEDIRVLRIEQTLKEVQNAIIRGEYNFVVEVAALLRPEDLGWVVDTIQSSGWEVEAKISTRTTTVSDFGAGMGILGQPMIGGVNFVFRNQDAVFDPTGERGQRQKAQIEQAMRTVSAMEPHGLIRPSDGPHNDGAMHGAMQRFRSVVEQRNRPTLVGTVASHEQIRALNESRQRLDELTERIAREHDAWNDRDYR